MLCINDDGKKNNNNSNNNKNTTKYFLLQMANHRVDDYRQSDCITVQVSVKSFLV